MSDIKEKLEFIIKNLADSIIEVQCPCCGEKTFTGNAINDPNDEFREIVTCEVNECKFYLTEYTDGTIELERA